MAGEARQTTIGEAADLLTGFPFKSVSFTEEPSDIRLVRGDNVVQGTLRWEGVKRWPSSKLDDHHDYLLRPGDVVLAMDRPWIEAGLKNATLTEADCPSLLVQRVARLRARAGVNQRFLGYIIRSVDFTNYILGVQTGTAVPHISGSQIKSYGFLLPSLKQQERAAEILSVIDDKIEANRRMAETLEAMARALFKSWIGAEGREASVSAQELIDQRVLQIGDGYRAKNDELATPGLPFLRAADLNGGINTAKADILSETSVARAGSKVSRPGDVAFTSKGTVGRFARVDERTPKFVYSPQVYFWRSLDSSRIHPALLYLMMQSPAFLAQIEQAAGQTDMAPYVSLHNQRRMVLPVLPSTQAGFGEDAHLLLSRQALLADHSRTLAALRDALLPKLISGELRIVDAEQRIAAA